MTKDQVVNLNEAPNKKAFLRVREITGSRKNGVIPVSTATIWHWVNEGKFPKPVKLSEAVTAWRVSDVESWLESRGVKDYSFKAGV